MFFEVFQASVDDLFHAKHFSPQQVADIVDMTVGKAAVPTASTNCSETITSSQC